MIENILSKLSDDISRKALTLSICGSPTNAFKFSSLNLKVSSLPCCYAFISLSNPFRLIIQIQWSRVLLFLLEEVGAELSWRSWAHRLFVPHTAKAFDLELPEWPFFHSVYALSYRSLSTCDVFFQPLHYYFRIGPYGVVIVWLMIMHSYRYWYIYCYTVPRLLWGKLHFLCLLEDEVESISLYMPPL